jgi:RNA polymerase sigma-32 factor
MAGRKPARKRAAGKPAAGKPAALEPEIVSGPGDDGPSDAGPSDTELSDAGPSDTELSDAGPSDTELSDAGPSDSEATDPEIEGPRDEDLAALDVDVADDDALPQVEPAPEIIAAPAATPTGRDLVRRDPLAAYMQEIRRIPLLSREEEHELAVKFFETGDLAIARRMITSNLRLVVKIAHEYRRAYRNLLDLVQEGNIGLMQAVRKYDPFRGVKLSSYAAWWIRAYILKFILNNWRMVKIGTTQAQRKLFFNLRKEKEKLEQLGFAPEHRLLAERLDVTEAEVAEMERRLESSDMSLDAPVSRDEEGGRTRLEGLSSSADTRPDVRVESEEFRSILRAKLEAFAADLEGREQLLFRERWLTDSPLTLQEIGDRFGISRERARQIEKRLLDRLRKYLEAELGTAVDIGAMRAEE